MAEGAVRDGGELDSDVGKVGAKVVLAQAAEEDLRRIVVQPLSRCRLAVYKEGEGPRLVFHAHLEGAQHRVDYVRVSWCVRRMTLTRPGAVLRRLGALVWPVGRAFASRGEYEHCCLVGEKGEVEDG